MHILLPLWWIIHTVPPQPVLPPLNTTQWRESWQLKTAGWWLHVDPKLPRSQSSPGAKTRSCCPTPAGERPLDKRLHHCLCPLICKCSAVGLPHPQRLVIHGRLVFFFFLVVLNANIKFCNETHLGHISTILDIIIWECNVWHLEYSDLVDQNKLWMYCILNASKIFGVLLSVMGVHCFAVSHWLTLSPSARSDWMCTPPPCAHLEALRPQNSFPPAYALPFSTERRSSSQIVMQHMPPRSLSMAAVCVREGVERWRGSLARRCLSCTNMKYAEKMNQTLLPLPLAQFNVASCWVVSSSLTVFFLRESYTISIRVLASIQSSFIIFHHPHISGITFPGLLTFILCWIFYTM